MRIRPATPRDVPALMALAQDLPTAAHWSNPQYNDLFTNVPRITLLIEDGATVLAFLVARASGPEWEIENIAVTKSHQRRGLATSLLRALIEQAKASQVVAIDLEVRASNQGAQGFYESNEFRETGRRPNYYTDPQEDAILYRLELFPADSTAP